MAQLSIDGFALKYLGKSVDYDGHYGYQCVDLMRLWIDNIKGKQPPSLADGAKHGYKRADPKYWTKIPYTGKNKPRGGDILFYNNSELGHVAIALRKDQTWPIHRVLEQNWKAPKVTKGEHAARPLNLIGWIRKLQSV